MTHATPQITLRRAAPADEVFLQRLFRETHTSVRDLPEPLRGALAAMQYRARALSYASAYPQSEDWILCLDPATPIGRQLIAHHAGSLYLIDLAVLPEYQGQGIGTQILQGCISSAARDGLALRLTVAQGNPAKLLYQRLGFTTHAEDEVNLEMVWSSRT